MSVYVIVMPDVFVYLFVLLFLLLVVVVCLCLFVCVFLFLLLFIFLLLLCSLSRLSISNVKVCQNLCSVGLYYPLIGDADGVF